MAEKIQIMGSTPVEEETGRDLPVLQLFGRAATNPHRLCESRRRRAPSYINLVWFPHQVAVAIPPSNDVDLFAHCAGESAVLLQTRARKYVADPD